ncbi:MAG: recombinase family protein, partial [Finegoldia magna]
GEVLLTIMASLAQQESQSLSQNVKLGFQYRFQQGQVQVNHNRFLGYTKDEEGKLVIVPEEAKIIKRIYREYLEGASLRDIKVGLEKDKIVNGAGNKKWHVSNLNQILTNEKYMGDALLQKTYTVDFLNKKRVKNDGIAPQYYVENSHEAIIPKEIFMRVQEEMDRRANMVSGKGKRRIYSSKYALSSIVYCSKCGDIYRRIAWNNRGKKYTVWRCCTRVTHGPDACEARTIREEDLQEAVVEAINQLISESSELKEIIKENIEKAITGDGSSQIEEIDKEMLEVQEELLKVANAKKDYTDLADRVEELRNEKEKILLNIAEEKNEQNRLKELEEFLDNQELEIESYDEDLVRKLVDKVVVYDEELKIVLKSGVEVNVCV